jgi:hypothetical protein
MIELHELCREKQALDCLEGTSDVAIKDAIPRATRSYHSVNSRCQNHRVHEALFGSCLNVMKWFQSM